MRDSTKSAIHNIVDTMNGSDGGVKYTNFLSMIDIVDKQACDGDHASTELIAVVERFSRLLDASSHSV